MPLGGGPGSQSASSGGSTAPGHAAGTGHGVSLSDRGSYYDPVSGALSIDFGYSIARDAEPSSGYRGGTPGGGESGTAAPPGSYFEQQGRASRIDPAELQTAISRNTERAMGVLTNEQRQDPQAVRQMATQLAYRELLARPEPTGRAPGAPPPPTQPPAQPPGGGFLNPANPALGNPEMGGGRGRTSQAAAIERATGGGFAGNFRRGVESFLGIREEVAIDRPTGLFGTDVRLSPINLLGTFMTAGPAIATAIAGFPALGLETALGVGNYRALDSLLGQPSISLGFRPTQPAGVAQRIADLEASGAALSPADQLYADFTRREAGFAAGRERDALQRGGTVDNNVPGPRSPRPPPVPLQPAPAASGAPDFSPPGSRRLTGRDDDPGIDLLRTTPQAAVAAGRARPRPKLQAGRSAGRPGALI